MNFNEKTADVISFADGSHIVALYTDEEKLLKSLIPFFAEALLNGEKCVYGAPESTLEKVKNELTKSGVPVQECLNREQLLLISDKEPFLNHGRFDARFLVDAHSALIKQALEEGYTHIRATVEMSWLIEGVPGGHEQLLKYEALSNELFNNTDKVHAICQYNNARLNGTQIVELMKIHPTALIDGQLSVNPFFTDPSPDYY